MKLQSALAALCLTLTVALVATICGRPVTAEPPAAIKNIEKIEQIGEHNGAPVYKIEVVTSVGNTKGVVETYFYNAKIVHGDVVDNKPVDQGETKDEEELAVPRPPIVIEAKNDDLFKDYEVARTPSGEPYIRRRIPSLVAEPPVDQQQNAIPDVAVRNPRFQVTSAATNEIAYVYVCDVENGQTWRRSLTGKTWIDLGSPVDESKSDAEVPKEADKAPNAQP